MGYMINNRKEEMHMLDSDSASDFVHVLSEIIVRELKKYEHEKENEFNTDGIVNVALVLQTGHEILIV